MCWMRHHKYVMPERQEWGRTWGQDIPVHLQDGELASDTRTILLIRLAQLRPSVVVSISLILEVDARFS